MILNIFRKRNLLRNMRMQISNLQFDVNINREEIDKMKAEIGKLKAGVYQIQPKQPQPKEVPIIEAEYKKIVKVCIYCENTFITELNSLRRYCPKKYGVFNYCKNRYAYENKIKLKTKK